LHGSPVIQISINDVMRGRQIQMLIQEEAPFSAYSLSLLCWPLNGRCRIKRRRERNGFLIASRSCHLWISACCFVYSKEEKSAGWKYVVEKRGDKMKRQK
jgi:hypothetical protein